MLDIDENIEFCPQCEADLTPYASLGSMPSFCLQCKFPLMLVAGKYRLQKIIGQGAVGTVYLGRHIRLNHNAERVVKVIKQELLTNRNTVQRFLREVQVTADLSERNEHIIRIYDDFGEIPHLGYFYVMEYVRGVSMRKYIQDQQQLPSLQWCLEIMRQLSVALQAAHENGVVHRDLKPDNIMLTEKSSHGTYVKVLDWGIAKPTTIVDENLTQGLVGTPHYMAPEQAMNLEIDARTDLYATGVILYELLTGINPFVAATGKKGKSHESMVDLIQAHLYEEPPSIHAVRPQRADVTPEIEGVMLKAMEKKPSNRYDSVMDFYGALQEAALQAGVQPSVMHTGLHHINPASLHGAPSNAPSNVPSGPILSNVSSSSPSYDLMEDTGLETTLDNPKLDEAVSSLSGRGTQEPHPPKPNKWGMWAGLVVVALLLVGGGVLGSQYLLNGTTPKPPKRTPAHMPTTTLRGTPKKQVTPRFVKAAPRRAVPDAGAATRKKAQKPPIKRAVRQPIRRRPLRRRPLRRRWRRRWRPRRRPRTRPRPAVVKPKPLCPKEKWRAVKIGPFLNPKAEVTAEPGRVQRINSRLFCVPPNTRRISIIQEGYSPCIFQVPTRLKKLKVRLQPADSGGLSAGQCLRSR